MANQDRKTAAVRAKQPAGLRRNATARAARNRRAARASRSRSPERAARAAHRALEVAARTRRAKGGKRPFNTDRRRTPTIATPDASGHRRSEPPVFRPSAEEGGRGPAPVAGVVRKVRRRQAESPASVDRRSAQPRRPAAGASPVRTNVGRRRAQRVTRRAADARRAQEPTRPRRGGLHRGARTATTARLAPPAARRVDIRMRHSVRELLGLCQYRMGQITSAGDQRARGVRST
jgi:hypothetical protein